MNTFDDFNNIFVFMLNDIAWNWCAFQVFVISGDGCGDCCMWDDEDEEDNKNLLCQFINLFLVLCMLVCPSLLLLLLYLAVCMSGFLACWRYLCLHLPFLALMNVSSLHRVSKSSCLFQTRPTFKDKFMKRINPCEQTF